MLDAPVDRAYRSHARQEQQPDPGRTETQGQVTVDLIRLSHLKGACSDQRALFRATFPKGAPVNQASIDKALAVGLSVVWLTCLLPDAARARYYRVVAASRVRYYRAAAPAGAEYDREYKRVVAAARAEYDRAEESALLHFLKAL